MSINIISECLVYVLSVFCVVHAYRQGKGWLALYLGACLNGFIPELLSVRTHTAYEYARFMVMIPSGTCPGTPLGAECVDAVPLWIVLGWGFVVYLAMQTSARLNIVWYLKPAHDALLAVNFDWLMDPIAVRLGWWIWDQPGQYFGVPLDNYIGWIVCVAAFSLSVRTARRYLFRHHPGLNDNATPFIAVLTGPAILIAVMELYKFVSQDIGVSPWLLLGLTLVAIFGISLALWSNHTSRQKPDWLVIGSGMLFQLYFCALLWYYGVFAEGPALITIAMLTIMIGWFGCTNPYAIRWLERLTSEATASDDTAAGAP